MADRYITIIINIITIIMYNVSTVTDFPRVSTGFS